MMILSTLFTDLGSAPNSLRGRCLRDRDMFVPGCCRSGDERDGDEMNIHGVPHGYVEGPFSVLERF